jgi:hypothetical protein
VNHLGQSDPNPAASAEGALVRTAPVCTRCDAARPGGGCTDTAPAWVVKQQTTYTYFLNDLLQTMKVWNGPSAGASLVQSHTLAYEDGRAPS